MDERTRFRAEGSTAPVRRHRRSCRRLVTVVAAATAAVLALTGLAVGWTYAGDVPRGTVVLGVQLGGKNRDEAAAMLRADLIRRADLLAAPLSVRVGEQTVQIRPVEVGLGVDVEATVDAAARQRPNPGSLLFGTRRVDPVVTVDAARLDMALRGGTGGAAEEMVMPGIVFAGLTPKPVYPAPSRVLDAQRSARAVREGWLTGRPVVVPLVAVYPATTAEEVDRLVEEVARPAVSGPVTVTTKRGDVTVTPQAIAASLVFPADAAGRIAPRVDGDRLRAALAGQLARIEVPARDARVTVGDNGRPTIVPAADGLRLDTAILAEDLLKILPRRQGRQVKGELVEARPRTTAETLAALRITERVATFTTRFTDGPDAPRSRNIARIAEQTDGVLLRPGEEFSVNRFIGPRTRAKGYRDAPVGVGDRQATGVGGGISQFTTTLFNAVLLAGLEDVEHRPHVHFTPEFPPVTEATVDYPDVDLRFRNDSGYGVLIDTSVTARSVTVSVWSTRVYDSVEIVPGPRRDVTGPTVVTDTGRSCVATAGREGFTQDVWRVFGKGGAEVRRQKFTWRYTPEPRIRCARGS